MKKLIFATGNENKVKEIQEILKDINIEVLSKKEIGFEDLEVVEDGDTLFENSKKKALALANKIDYAIIADDSGLFVDALNDKPGVHSSRYAGEEGNDDRNNEKLLKDLEEIKEEDRTARFKAVITLITEDKEIYEIEGICEGHIDFQLKGSNGFGYDPLFIPEGYSKSFGELSDEIKNKISHRYKALLELKEKLEELIRS